MKNKADLFHLKTKKLEDGWLCIRHRTDEIYTEEAR